MGGFRRAIVPIESLQTRLISPNVFPCRSISTAQVRVLRLFSSRLLRCMTSPASLWIDFVVMAHRCLNLETADVREGSLSAVVTLCRNWPLDNFDGFSARSVSVWGIFAGARMRLRRRFSVMGRVGMCFIREGNQFYREL